MEDLTLNIPKYPMLRWIARSGGWLAALPSLALLAAGVMAAVRPGGLLIGLGLALAGVLVFVVIRTMVEMVRLITDMLLPK